MLIFFRFFWPISSQLLGIGRPARGWKIPTEPTLWLKALEALDFPRFSSHSNGYIIDPLWLEYNSISSGQNGHFY